MERIIGTRLSELIDGVLKITKREFAEKIGVENGRPDGVTRIINGSRRTGKNYERIKRVYPQYWDWLVGKSDDRPAVNETPSVCEDRNEYQVRDNYKDDFINIQSEYNRLLKQQIEINSLLHVTKENLLKVGTFFSEHPEFSEEVNSNKIKSIIDRIEEMDLKV